MSRLTLVALAAFALCADASANDARKPYKIRIVVDVAKHRLLTDVFKQQLGRELKDGVQAAFGKLASVEVADTHETLADVRAVGLQRALDGYRKVGDEKVFFVLVGFDGTRYEIQTRQYDGDLRMASPAVRKERTRDRAYVSRQAALLLDKDVGLTGTIESEPDAGKRVKVSWRGSGLGVDLGRWLKKGEVLAVANPQAGGESAQAWTFLQLDAAAKDGPSGCVLFSRYRTPRAVGLRCMLLGTRSGPMRLRLMEQPRGGGTLKELDNAVQLEFRHHGFEGEDATLLEVSGGDNGDVIDTAEKGKEKGRFDRIAFMTVKSGDAVKARIPIALIDDRQITVPIPVDDEPTNEALERHRSLSRNTLSAAQVLADLFTEVNALTADANKRGEALARVRQALKRSQDDYARLNAERRETMAEVEKMPEGSRPSFQAIDARLTQMYKAAGELRKHVEVLEKIEKEETDPTRKKWRGEIERAKGLEKEADVDKAIAIYKQVPKEYLPQGLDKHVAELEKQWKPVDAAHATARQFAYKTYGGLRTADVGAKWKDAEGALEAFKKHNDRWGLTKLLKASERHRDRATGEANALKPQLNPDDAQPAKEIADVLAKLVKLIDDGASALERVK